MTLARTRTHESVCAHLNLNICLPAIHRRFFSRIDFIGSVTETAIECEWVRRTFRYIIIFSFVCLLSLLQLLSVSAANVFVWKILWYKFISVVSLCLPLLNFFPSSTSTTRIKTKRISQEEKRREKERKNLNGLWWDLCSVCMCITCVSGELVKQVFHFCLCLLLLLLLHHQWHDECFLSF